MFHFNKKHLEDTSIPMWVLKLRGQTYYVNHVDFYGVSFSTKETPDSVSTKGSLKFKGFVSIDENNNATITGEKQ